MPIRTLDTIIICIWLAVSIDIPVWLTFRQKDTQKKFLIRMHERLVFKQTPSLLMEWHYTFLDLSPSAAFVHQTFNISNNVVACVAVIGLNKATTKTLEDLFDSMTHESLHMAIKTCCLGGALGEEWVIRKMMEGN